MKNQASKVEGQGKHATQDTRHKTVFYKYQGTGNDFILLDNRKNNIHLSRPQIERFCNRRFGIGADGLMLLQNKAGYDFEMVYYNSDGRESSMCGNGGRCISMFANKLGIIQKKATFWAIDGEHEASISNNQVRLKMQDVLTWKKTKEYLIVNTGSPHYVQQQSNDMDNFVENARKIRYSKPFKKEGININFVNPTEASGLNIRTYERGVEDETLSCGTGAVAAAIFQFLEGSSTKSIPSHHSTSFHLETLGGNLKVHLNKSEKGFENIWLEGPAKFVFEGEIHV